MHTFYADPALRQRLVEFLGGDTLPHATAVHVTHTDGCLLDRRELRPPAELDWFLERDIDIARSLADSRSYLLHLDMEYVNFESPAEAFVDPERCFALQEPMVKVIESLLLGWGIRPLHLMTGRGHHFMWRIDRDSELACRIRDLCPAPELVRPCLERMPPILAGGIEPRDQEMFAALALVIEFLAHRIKETVADVCLLPLELTAVQSQREIISLDISEYGDPLHTRVIRLPFSNYRKPWESGLAYQHAIPPFRVIPLHEMDFREALRVRGNEVEVLALARRACVRIPLQEDGTRRLLEDYLASRLRRIHQHFYSDRHDPKARWPETYDRTPLGDFPDDIHDLLAFPNDRLLKPAGLRAVTHCLLDRGWHPRHIAGLVRSKFENPRHGWGVDWNDYEPATRADFYIRLFACLRLTGLDASVKSHRAYD